MTPAELATRCAAFKVAAPVDMQDLDAIKGALAKTWPGAAFDLVLTFPAILVTAWDGMKLLARASIPIA